MQAFDATLNDAFPAKTPDVTEENIQSRCRGIILMALSNKFGPMVLSTGNKSEMSVGYSTLVWRYVRRLRGAQGCLQNPGL